MKKFTFFIVVTLCVSSISFSQINKGSVLLGGNISFGFGTTENVTNTIPNTSTNYKNHGFLVSPSVGIAIKENTILGIGLSYGNSKNGDEQSPQSQNTSSVGGNIYVRKYLLLGKNFYLFGQANTYYNYTKQDNKTANGDMNNYKVSRIGFNFYPGLSYAVNRKLHLDAGINNLWTWATLSINMKTSILAIKAQLQVKAFHLMQMQTSQRHYYWYPFFIC